MKEYTTRSEAQTEALAAEIAVRLLPGDVLAYRGGLGAGKTAFTRGLAAGLGLRAEVTSPTFALVNEYREGPVPLFHFDMYRVASWDALESTGFFDYLDAGGILAVEWSEQIENALPANAITVDIAVIGETDRRIRIEGGGRF